MFPVRLAEALVEIFGPQRGRNIVMKGAEDGSGYPRLPISPSPTKSFCFVVDGEDYSFWV